jgi:hypothetical protein
MSYYRRSERNFWLGIGGLALVLVLLIVAWGVFYYEEDTHTDCVVSDKDRTTTSSGTSDARIYTDNCGVFQVADSWIKGEFNSADTYSDIEVGETYTFTTIGWRFGPLSMFPNIIEVSS